MRDKINFLLQILQTIALVIIIILIVRLERFPGLREVHQQLAAKDNNMPPIELNQYDAIWGSNEAEYTLVAYIDYECPYCKILYQNIKSVAPDYIESGKVKVILRDLPLKSHPAAKTLALAAECARKQGKFWDFSNKALSSKEAFSDSLLFVWSSEIGMDSGAMKICMADAETEKVVKIDFDDAKSRNLRGTPAVFINNTYYRGSISEKNLRLIFEGKSPKKNKSGSACR